MTAAFDPDAEIAGKLRPRFKSCALRNSSNLRVNKASFCISKEVAQLDLTPEDVGIYVISYQVDAKCKFASLSKC